MKTPDPVEILSRLFAARVEFIVVGMAAGVLRGAPVSTADLDIVHLRTPENITRLLEVLAEIDAVYRHDPRHLRPEERHLVGPGHQLLTTRYGDLDCLGTIGEGQAYEDLLTRAPQLTLQTGISLHVLDLPTLIEFKEKAARPKDLAVLPVLHATLNETRKRS